VLAGVDQAAVSLCNRRCSEKTGGYLLVLRKIGRSILAKSKKYFAGMLNVFIGDFIPPDRRVGGKFHLQGRHLQSGPARKAIVVVPPILPRRLPGQCCVLGLQKDL
jgi:hypothetical protein